MSPPVGPVRAPADPETRSRLARFAALFLGVLIAISWSAPLRAESTATPTQTPSMPATGFPLRSVSVTSAQPDPVLRLHPEGIWATLEGEWMAPKTSACPAPGKEEASTAALGVPFPTLVIHVPAEIPSSAELVTESVSAHSAASEPIDSAALKSVTLDIPVLALGESKKDFHLVFPKGEVVDRTVTLNIRLDHDVTLAAPLCEQESISLRAGPSRAKPPASPRLFLLSCGSSEGALNAAVEPIGPFDWKSHDPSSACVSGDKKALVGQSAYDKASDPLERTLLAFDGGAEPSSYEVVQFDGYHDRWYGHFRLNGIAVLQSSGGGTYSYEPTWNPVKKLSPQFALLGNLGFSVLKNGILQEHFVALDYQILAAYSRFKPVTLELGGGAQSWIGQSWTHPVISANAAWIPRLRPIRFVDRVQLGYSLALGAGDLTQEYRLGLGFSF